MTTDRMMTLFAMAFCITFIAAATTMAADDAPAGAKVLRLWEANAPGALGKDMNDQPTNDVPTITIYPPAAGKNNGAALVVCPGGGYGHLADHEGKPVAEWFTGIGGTGIVLRYRLGPKYHHPAMMNDVSRAIRMTRSHAAEWGIDSKRIAVIGFSAGGHLASTAATHFDDGDPSAADPVDRVSSRPDAAILVYPVISTTAPFSHAGSRKNLLGENPDPKLVQLMSNELQVTDKTPPTYLVHATDDKVVPVENSLAFAAELSKHKIPWAGRIFDHGGHGFGVGGRSEKDPELSTWPKSCAEWLEHRKFFQK